MRKIRNAFIIFITVIAAFVLQSSVFPMLPVSIITPNFLLALTSAYALLLGSRKGLAIGFLCGLLYDIFFGSVIGFHTLVYAVIGFGCGRFEHLMFVEDLKFPALLAAGSDFVYGFLCFVFQFLVQNRLIFSYFLTHMILPEMLYTALVSFIIYPIVLWLHGKYLRDIRESEKNFV
ncbi:MAG: rod shape-determining protein MreD [Lachnospiraceae bacterium]|nr:rod shape-determining protein MreD [Lachnospiraceae bacterium]MBQ6363849.1 rod shape-determining protein MreD [Lachnospiraceae bacterium]MBR2996297.1 rod shape-determining protein MreD [Lachnospiraceae bacterium]